MTTCITHAFFNFRDLDQAIVAMLAYSAPGCEVKGQARTGYPVTSVCPLQD